MSVLAGALHMLLASLPLCLASSTLTPPTDAIQKKLFSYDARMFGFCARGARCRSGSRWVEKARVSEGKWLLPETLPRPKAQAHYLNSLRKAGFKVITTENDEGAQTFSLAAVRAEPTGQVRGLDLLIRPAYAVDAAEPGYYVVEYWAGTGTRLGANH